MRLHHGHCGWRGGLGLVLWDEAWREVIHEGDRWSSLKWKRLSQEIPRLAAIILCFLSVIVSWLQSVGHETIASGVMEDGACIYVKMGIESDEAIDNVLNSYLTFVHLQNQP